jgi:uncharacterized phage protein (TIGR01671 family)
MNRPIKFRGKRADTGEWVFGYYTEFHGDHFIYTGEKSLFKISPVHRLTSEEFFPTKITPGTAGQFTGLLDINGKEIYEGDILIVDELCCLQVVKYRDTSFLVAGVDELKRGEQGDIWYFPEFTEQTSEVVGNIHDNSELLEYNP